VNAKGPPSGVGRTWFPGYVAKLRNAPLHVRAVATAKSGLHTDLLPKLNSRTIRLPDVPRLMNQIDALERRTFRGGKDSIDHPPQAYDYLASVVAGVYRHAASISTRRRVMPFPF
jgi:hypothetical protein